MFFHINWLAGFLLSTVASWIRKTFTLLRPFNPDQTKQVGDHDHRLMMTTVLWKKNTCCSSYWLVNKDPEKLGLLYLPQTWVEYNLLWNPNSQYLFIAPWLLELRDSWRYAIDICKWWWYRTGKGGYLIVGEDCQKKQQKTEHWFCARSNESSITRFQGSSWTDMASCCCGSYSMKVSSPSQRSQVCGSTSLPRLGTSWAWQAKKNNVSQIPYHPCVIYLHLP